MKSQKPCVPFLDFTLQYEELRTEVLSAIDETLKASNFTLGARVAQFEAQFATYCRQRYAVGVNNGTSALHLALVAAGVGPGDEVITTPLTFVASVAAIEAAGATPVLADIDGRTLNIDPSAVEAAITCRTKAIMPVHLHGLMADVHALKEISDDCGAVLIEDAAQAHGAECQGQRSGSVGLFGSFSFYPGKNLGAYGEAGAVVTGDSEKAAQLRCLRDWGQESKSKHVMKGFNYRMDAIQAAVLEIKLRYIEAWTESRREIAQKYTSELKPAGIETPEEPAGYLHSYHVYALKVPDREGLREQLSLMGIETSIHYPTPVHLQPAYTDLGYKIGEFPESELAAARLVSLPIFPGMTREQTEMVATAVLRAI